MVSFHCIIISVHKSFEIKKKSQKCNNNIEGDALFVETTNDRLVNVFAWPSLRHSPEEIQTAETTRGSERELQATPCLSSPLLYKGI